MVEGKHYKKFWLILAFSIQFAERLHFTAAIHPEHDSLSISMATSTGACMPHPCDTSKNQTKLEWCNSTDGTERRNQEGSQFQ